MVTWGFVIFRESQKNMETVLDEILKAGNQAMTIFFIMTFRSIIIYILYHIIIINDVFGIL